MFAKLPSCADELLPSRLFGESERRGDLGVGVSLEIVQEHDLALPRREVLERGEQRSRSLSVLRNSSLGLRDLRRSRQDIAETPSHERPTSSVPRDGEEPPVEALGIAALSDVLECHEQHGLRHVLGVAGSFEMGECDGIDGAS